jgi:iron only hydrogenase large subunit-like protein/PAS domain-containing protein
MNAYIHPIYTEKHECRDCYKCVRACPVKAIRVNNGSAVVDHHRCIFCGKCVAVCPANAKKIRNDIAAAKKLLTSRKSVYVSLAPSFSAEFSGYEDQVLKGLVKLGFTGISETALGAQLVSERVDALISKRSASDNITPYISSACPSVVEMVRKYYPQLIGDLTPVHSPLGAHSTLLRDMYGSEIGVVFIGPCIAKKLEADRHPGFPDISLTFAELRQWFTSELIDIRNPHVFNQVQVEYSDPAQQWFSIPGNQEVEHESTPEMMPHEAGQTAGYAVESGMLSTLSEHTYLVDEGASASGAQSVLQALDTISTNAREYVLPEFFELLSCSGGCVNGPGCTAHTEVYRKITNNRYTRNRIERVKDYPPGMHLNSVDIFCSYQEAEHFRQRRLRTSEISATLTALGKGRESDRLNCGGCGYNSCEDFAAAYLEGMAEAEMCVTNMRKQAQSKVDVLLRTLPMGVVIVDHSFGIMDCNAQFLKMFSTVSYDADERELTKIAGLDIDAFIDIKSHLNRQFSAPNDIERITLNVDERVVKATFFTVDPKRVCGALFHDVTDIALRRDAVVKKAEEVIKKNLQSVQQIASLLGENAADTEIMLSSMKDLFDQSSLNSRSQHGR